ncbi:DUF551 domain-containing protein [Rodentibacter abscessus]|uniref:DUF551 domain-containing protein n=1 Tax=Rodentibacter abscessus TaxID=3381777 RepID=UPI00399D2C21
MSENNGWIKCSEQLPEDSRLVIAFMPSREDDPGYWMMFIGYFDDEWWCDTGGELYNPMHVSHWKHLPQTPHI